MENNRQNEWLCRNCNTLISSEISHCPKCGSDYPEESTLEPAPEGISESVVMEKYTNLKSAPKAKYNFRENVLIYAADILLTLALFCTFGALIAPMFLTDIDNIKLISLAAAISLFAFAMISWATLRTLAFISERLRNRS